MKRRQYQRLARDRRQRRLRAVSYPPAIEDVVVWFETHPEVELSGELGEFHNVRWIERSQA